MAVKTKKTKTKKAETEETQPMIIKARDGSEIARYDRKMMETVKNTVAKEATDEELYMFLTLASQYDLDPFKKELWFIKYGDKEPQIFTSRDGFVKIAKKDPEFKQIQSSPVFENDDFEVEQSFTGNGFEITGFRHKYNAKERGKVVGAFCIIEYYTKKPLMVYVDFNEYKSSTATWKTHPSSMIKKVAEKEACRLSAGISGLHIPEEMGSEYDVDATEEDYKKAQTRKLKMAQSKTPVFDEEDIEIIDVDINESLEQLDDMEE